MTRHHQRIDDDEDDDSPIDRHGVLKDGARVRVPMFLMDATQRAIAQNAAHLHDAAGNAPGHRPGFAMDANDAGAARRRMYDAYDREKAAEYLTGAGGREGAEGATCTCKNGTFPEYFGSEGRIVDGTCTPLELIDEGELRDMQPVRVGDGNMTLDALEREHDRRMNKVYADHDRALVNAWRSP